MRSAKRGFAAILTAWAVVAGTPVAQAADTPKPGGTLVIGSTQVPRHLNGAVQSGIATGLPSAQLFASPLRYDADWKPQPYLAQRWCHVCSASSGPQQEAQQEDVPWRDALHTLRAYSSGAFVRGQ